MASTWESLARISRRGFFGCGSAALLPVQAFAQGSDKIAAASDDAHHLTIGVKVDGKGPFQFVVDTGSDRSVISDDVARQLGLTPDIPVFVEGIARTIPARTTKLRNIAFGNVSHSSLEVPVLPRETLDADGYLGLDAIDGYRVTFDFADHLLEIDAPDRPANLQNNGDAVVSVYGAHGRLRALNCRVDDVPTVVFVDSGAELSIGNSALYQALLARAPTYAAQGIVTFTGVTGGKISGLVTQINEIKLSSLMFLRSEIMIADPQIFDNWNLGERPALLVGMNFLRKFDRVSIDYGRKELRFDLASIRVAGLG